MIKARVIAHQRSGERILGLTIPKELAIFFEGVSFNVNKSGACLTFTSGTIQTVTKEDIKNFNLKDLKI